MAKYDDAAWHYGGDYPAELPKANAATHIGMLLSWCIDNDLLSEFQLEESEADVKRVQQREMSGADFLMVNCDGKFTDEDLNELGNGFVADYYDEESGFAKQFAPYLADYQMAAELLYKEMGQEMKSVYHIENSWEFYEGIKIILDLRFGQWKRYKQIS